MTSVRVGLRAVFKVSELILLPLRTGSHGCCLLSLATESLEERIRDNQFVTSVRNALHRALHADRVVLVVTNLSISLKLVSK